MAEEKNFENRVKKFLEANGAWFVKYFANGFTKSGIPDILCCVNGRFLAVEVKAKRGIPSPLQIRQRSLIQKAGGISVILFPDQFEDFKLMITSVFVEDEQNVRMFERRINWRTMGEDDAVQSQQS